MPKRIVIAGGGTGGHIFPAIAVANALKKADPALSILFIGAKGKMEMEKVPQAGYDITGLDIVGFDRGNLLRNLKLPFKLLKSFLKVRSIFRDFKPDAAFGVGGYSSYPVLRVAQARRIPTFLHESNAFAGKSNMMLGKKATRVFVANKGMEKFFPADRIMITGNPVRTAIAHNTISREEALKQFGLEAGKTTIMVMGGSLGARSINEAVANGLDQFAHAGIQLIWQTGKLFTDKAKALATGRTGIWVNDFITDMQYAYAAADLVISRSGAMSVTELCVTGKPALFVPYPFAAEDHQTANALALVKEGGAILVPDGQAGETLVQTALNLAANKDEYMAMGRQMKAAATLDADNKIAHEILKAIHA